MQSFGLMAANYSLSISNNYLYMFPDNLELLQQRYQLQSYYQSNMKLSECTPLTPKEKAVKLGLTSSRFLQKQMTQHAREAIQYVKKKDRSDTKLQDWRRTKFNKKDATKQLFTCPQNITRVHTENLSIQDFIQKFQKPNLPVVIQGCTKDWDVDKYWTFQYFYRQFKDIKFKIGEDDDGYKLRVPLKYYFEYLVFNKDDSPLYMFQSSLENNKDMHPILNHFQVPPYFRDDLLKYAGEKKRPPYRWLLMGPERSGSTVHIDPLSTSAWNTSLQGHKRWVLFPENIPKFIVKGKAFRRRDYEDESINYFTEILPKIIESQGRERLGIIQFIQKPGETVFVPGGWWHAVLNLDDTMAVTQNIMTHVNFDKVWKSIRSQRRKFAFKYLQNLKQNEQELYQRALKINQIDNYQMGNKYEAQSVSLSFTATESSSSSSSQSSSSQDDSKSQNSRRSKSQNSRNEYSRSRDKKKQKRTHSVKNKKRKYSS